MPEVGARPTPAPLCVSLLLLFLALCPEAGSPPWPRAAEGCPLLVTVIPGACAWSLGRSEDQRVQLSPQGRWASRETGQGWARAAALSTSPGWGGVGGPVPH